MTYYKKWVVDKLGKNGTRALKSANDIDDFINKAAQPIARNKTRAMKRIDYIVKTTGKPYCNDYGIHNPNKLNISNDTLNKIKGE